MKIIVLNLFYTLIFVALIYYTYQKGGINGILTTAILILLSGITLFPIHEFPAHGTTGPITIFFTPSMLLGVMGIATNDKEIQAGSVSYFAFVFIVITLLLSMQQIL